MRPADYWDKHWIEDPGKELGEKGITPLAYILGKKFGLNHSYILHVGFGSGYLTRSLIDMNIQVDGIDIANSACRHIHKWIKETDRDGKFVCGDASHPASYEHFEDEKYDFVIYDGVAHTMLDGSETTVLEQSYHKLKDGGIFAFEDIIKSEYNDVILNEGRKRLNDLELENEDGSYLRTLNVNDTVKKFIYSGYQILYSEVIKGPNTNGYDTLRIFAQKGPL